MSTLAKGAPASGGQAERPRPHSSLRRHLPVHSPLSVGALVAGAGALLRTGEDPRQRLVGLITRRFQVTDALLRGSGTESLQVALGLALERAHGLGLERRVAIPAFSCFDVASATVWTGARVHFYDVDPETLSPDLATLERALGAGASVVLVSPLFGLPVPWEPIERLTSRHGAVLVEDAAQGFGTEWRGRPLGSLGDISVLSFGRGKGWTAGKGGAVLFPERFTEPTDGRPRARVALASSLVGDLKVVVGSVAHWLLGRPWLYGIPSSLPWLGLGETRYHPPHEPGPMSAAAAAMALAVEAQSRAEVLTRRENARALLAVLDRSSALHPVGLHADRGASFLRLPVLGSAGLAGFRSPEGARALGIMRSYPQPLPELPEMALRTDDRGPWPGAERLANALLTLPTHSMLNRRERDALVAAVATYGS